MTKSEPGPPTTATDTTKWALAPRRTLKRKPHRLSIASDYELSSSITSATTTTSATTSAYVVNSPPTSGKEEPATATLSKEDCAMFTEARYSFEDVDDDDEQEQLLLAAATKRDQQSAARTLRRTNRTSSSSSASSSTTSSATMEDLRRRKYLSEGAWSQQQQQHAPGFLRYYSDDDDKESLYSVDSTVKRSSSSHGGTSNGNGNGISDSSTSRQPLLLPSLAEHRALTSAVLRYDRLQSQNLLLRSHLAAECDALDAADETYAARLHELGLLRFERKFLAEVVALSTPRMQRGVLGSPAARPAAAFASVGEEDGVGDENADEDEVKRNSRRTQPRPPLSLSVTAAEPSGALYSSLPTLALNLETQMDLHGFEPQTSNGVDETHRRRWSVDTPAWSPATAAAVLASPFASTDQTALAASPTSPTSSSPTSDDWSSRALQRSAFLAMSTAIREAISTKTPHPPAQPLESKSLTTTTSSSSLSARTTHLAQLSTQLANTNAELRAALDDLRVGPLPAYAAWIRDVEREIGVWAKATRALREERRRQTTTTTSTVGGSRETVAVAGSGDWEAEDEDEEDEEDVFYDCEEGDEDGLL
ncbi:hypothetical protein HDU86_002564 [Geranomyces michiganensis]|nr:hypothetical protein HDU86_002564 [Geranomyces michiganensis]